MLANIFICSGLVIEWGWRFGRLGMCVVVVGQYERVIRRAGRYCIAAKQNLIVKEHVPHYKGVKAGSNVLRRKSTLGLASGSVAHAIKRSVQVQGGKEDF